MPKIPLQIPRSWLALTVLCACYLGAAGFLLVRFPPVNLDEINTAVVGRNFVTGQGAVYSLNDDIFAASAYAIRNILNQSSRVVNAAWAGIWMILFPYNYIALRWSALSAGLGALLFLYGIGKKVGGPTLGLRVTTLTLAFPIFWAASLVDQQFTLLSLLAAGLLWLTLTRTHFPWRSYILGCIAGLGMGIHPIILAFSAGWEVFRLFTEPSARRVADAAQVSSGFLTGFLLAFAPVQWAHYWLFQKSIYWQFAQPPILSWPWHPVDWLMTTLKTTLQASTFYFDTSGVWGWRQALAFFWAGVALILAHGYLSPNRILKSWRWALGTVFLGMVLLVRRQEMVYGLVLAPFLFPFLGLSWGTSSAARVKGSFAIRLVAGSSLVVSFLCLVIFAVKSVNRTKPFYRVAEEIQALMPQPPVRMVGPNFLWLLYGDDLVRDGGALVTSRYYTGGQWNLQESLSTWRPEVIFINDQFRKIFLQSRSPEALLPSLLGASAVRRLGSVETFPPYGNVDLYSIQWPPPQPS